MSILNSIFAEIGQNIDVANMAAKVGIDPKLAEMAVSALAQAHVEPGNTVEGAAAKTGIDIGTLTQIVEHIGGEGSLTEFNNILKDHPQAAAVASLLDRDGDGNPLNDIAGMAQGLFNKS